MTYIIRQGRDYTFMSEKDIEITKAVPPGCYMVKHNPIAGYYLSEVEEFENPPKFYGDTIKVAERILETYRLRGKSTGVHLDGVKGAGKTLLARTVANLGIQKGMCALIVSAPFCGDEFNQFIQGIGRNVIVLFDEFEKIYDNDSQQKILTLFDGVYNQKMLFLITTNESWKVNEFLKNRPGRIFYSLSYDTLSPEFVEEYCLDQLQDKTKVDSVVRFVTVFDYVTFDMLQAIVEEMNRYDETIQDVMKFINVKAFSRNKDSYTLYVVFDDVRCILDKMCFINPIDADYTVPNLAKYGVPEKLVAEAFEEYKQQGHQPHNDAPELKRKPVAEKRTGSGLSIKRIDDDDAYKYEMELGTNSLVSIDPKAGVYTYKLGEIVFEFHRNSATKEIDYMKMF